MGKIRDYITNEFREIVVHTIFIIIYLVVSIYYIEQLKAYNELLYGLSWIEVLFFNNRSTFFYFGEAVVLEIIAFYFIYKTIVYRYFIDYNINKIIIFTYFAILICISIIIFIEISNPILKAMFLGIMSIGCYIDYSTYRK